MDKKGHPAWVAFSFGHCENTAGLVVIVSRTLLLIPFEGGNILAVFSQYLLRHPIRRHGRPQAQFIHDLSSFTFFVDGIELTQFSSDAMFLK